MYLPAALTGAPLPPAQALRGVAPLAPTTQAGRDFLATLPGRSVAALVLGRAEDGHGIVEIEGHQITVAADLPPPGTRITLRFADGAPATATTAAALTRGTAAALSASLAANDGDVAVELGEGALSLGRFAETPLEPLHLGQVKANVEAPAEWAQALAHMLSDSGTFYESHLAAWSHGNYSLEQIRNEPQADAGRTASPPPPVPGMPQEAVATIRADAVLAPAQTQTAANLSSGEQNTGVPETLQPVVREQLHALETQTVPFSVEAWPGQRADLVIGREPDGRGASGPAGDGGWKTQLKLQLPQLGSIAATLTLQGDRLWLDLAAPPESAAALDAAGGPLSNAMLAAGIRLVRTRVLREDHDGGE